MVQQSEWCTGIALHAYGVC